jgi:signal transduction histidine kinase
MNLSQQLQSAIMPEDLLYVSTSTISRSLRVPYVAIAIRYGDGVIKQAEYGTNGMPTESFPLVHQNEAVGELIIGQRSPNETLNSADEAVLSSIAQQLGAVAYAVRLQSELQIARERLVIAREEERRRIRRDLHDGLGPALASQPLKIDAAIDLVKLDGDKAIDLLAQIKKQSQSLVADVRRLVHDLRPPALDELGLIEALRNSLSQMSSSKSGLEIHFHIKNDLPILSAAVEVATYRIVMEAVNNVFKHARASNCDIAIQVLGNQPRLHISIQDDGIGLTSVLTAGVGLQSMRERCEELGGTFGIEPSEPQGTRVTAILPLARGSTYE